MMADQSTYLNSPLVISNEKTIMCMILILRRSNMMMRYIDFSAFRELSIPVVSIFDKFGDGIVPNRCELNTNCGEQLIVIILSKDRKSAPTKA